MKFSLEKYLIVMLRIHRLITGTRKASKVFFLFVYFKHLLLSVTTVFLVLLL